MEYNPVSLYIQMLTLPIISNRRYIIPPEPPPLSPCDLGLPEKFKEWRAEQWSGVERILDSKKRFIVICAATGTGKTIISMAAAILTGRTVVLTATRGLQDQIFSDFADLSSDIRGLNNYTCPITESLGIPKDTSVADAPCQCGYGCGLKRSGCSYFDSYRTAQQADIVCSNYQCWLYDGIKQNTDRGNLQYGMVPDGLDIEDDLKLQEKQKVRMLVCDECFVAGTMIGETPIEMIVPGDLVPSFDEVTKTFVHRRVNRVFKKKTDTVCRLHFSDGSTVACTLNHPFYTNRGWKISGRLLLGTMLCLRYGKKTDKNSIQDNVRNLWEENSTNTNQEQSPKTRLLLQPEVRGNKRQFDLEEEPEDCQRQMPGVPQEFYGVWRQTNNFVPWYKMENLRTTVCREVGGPSLFRKGGEAIQRAHEKEESYVEPNCQGQDESISTGNGVEAYGPRWQWPRAVHLSETASFDFGVANGGGDPDKINQELEEALLADVLQGRYSSLCFAGSDRSGWNEPSSASATGFGSEEGSDPNWVRVDGFEIYKQADRQGFERVCPDGYVYNLEVEGTHTYLANGFVVHNCHDLVDQLSMFLGVEFSRRECLSIRLDWPDAGLSVDDWQQWAMDWQSKVNARVASAETKLKSSGGRSWSKELKHLRDIKRKLDRLSGMQADDGWIMNETDVEGKSMAGVRFDPLSPARYAEESLWRGIEKIVLVSATVRPKTAELLGIKSGDLEFCEYGSSFDPKRRPVIFVPTVRMDFRTEQDDHAMRWMLNKIDDLIEARLDRKGIIHAVSYSRSRFIVANSKHSHLMITHGKHDKTAAIEKFRNSDAPSILVSPSVDTGYDFPGLQARYQLLIKIPFVSKSDKIVAARSKIDKEYPNYIAAQTLVQASGRIMRSADDFGESILTDSHAEWFIPKVRKFLPKWWLESYSICDEGMPKPIHFDE